MKKNETQVNESGFRSLVSGVTHSTTFGVFLILVLLCVVMTIVAGNVFLTKSNLLSVIRQFSFTAIVAIGVTLVIITGGIDLSLGSVYALAGVFSGIAMVNWGCSDFISLLVGLGVAALCGLINASFVTLLSFPPFISTLGMMSVARGLAFGITNGYPIYGLTDSFKFMGQGSVLGIPMPILLMLVLAIIFSFFLRKTKTGRRIYAIGGNEDAARVSGIAVNRIKVIVYIASATLAGFAGILASARLGTAQPAGGTGMEMDAIAAVIIGGASLSGGVGNIAGAIIGAAIMGVLDNALTLLSVSAYWQELVIGVVILCAIALDRVRSIRASKG